MDKTFFVYNFGCKVNQEEGAGLAALFNGAGWREDEDAGLYIVNTCTVTQVADKKCRALIRRLRREHPRALLVVTGCYAQTDAASVAALGVDIVAGLSERAQLPALVEQRLKTGQPLTKVADIAKAKQFVNIGPAARQKRARAYLKIQDGCDQYCNYCIIPHARGPVRSLPLKEALEQARVLLQAGHHELVLSGIHIGAYGQDLPEEENLPALISAILALGGDFRLRLGSIEPRQFSPALCELLAKERRLCPHLHIPLQAGCDRTLAAMGRDYDTAFYAALLAKLRGLSPRLAITTDVMVGYPGETEQDFEDTLAFCDYQGFAKMHIFPYSRRAGTIAAALPDQIAQKEKARRAARLGAVAKRLAENYTRGFIGQALQYLFEQETELQGQRFYEGHSENYLPLLLTAESLAPVGLIMARASFYREGYLLCERE